MPQNLKAAKTLANAHLHPEIVCVKYSMFPLLFCFNQEMMTSTICQKKKLAHCLMFFQEEKMCMQPSPTTKFIQIVWNHSHLQENLPVLNFSHKPITGSPKMSQIYLTNQSQTAAKQGIPQSQIYLKNQSQTAAKQVISIPKSISRTNRRQPLCRESPCPKSISQTNHRQS